MNRSIYTFRFSFYAKTRIKNKKSEYKIHMPKQIKVWERWSAQCTPSTISVQRLWYAEYAKKQILKQKTNLRFVNMKWFYPQCSNFDTLILQAICILYWNAVSKHIAAATDVVVAAAAALRFNRSVFLLSCVHTFAFGWVCVHNHTYMFMLVLVLVHIAYGILFAWEQTTFSGVNNPIQAIRFSFIATVICSLSNRTPNQFWMQHRTHFLLLFFLFNVFFFFFVLYTIFKNKFCH